jgi:predicted FMN-binding regulatory protein PaiB
MRWIAWNLVAFRLKSSECDEPGSPLIHYDYYADIPAELIEAFVREQELGRLLTVADDGLPHLGLYPFAYDGNAIEIHLNRTDDQLAHLTARPRCAFELDEILATVPSYWVDPESAVAATAYHRTVLFECQVAMISDDAAVLAAQQTRLLARYQPEGGFRAVTADEPIYRGAFGVIRAVRLAITGRKLKWKIGQNRPPEKRARVVAELRQRGRPRDARAADALQWTIEREASRRP